MTLRMEGMIWERMLSCIVRIALKRREEGEVGEV